MGQTTRHERRVGALWVAAAFIAGCTNTPAGNTGDQPDDAPEPPAATATVERQNLTASDELTGWLGYDDPVPLVASRDGVVTWMPEEGTVIDRGGVVAEIDGAETRLLIGERPAWRGLAVGEPDGPDIKQLNDNLAALGYAQHGELPNERFDWRTRRAVSRWQGDLGLPRTGALEAADVVFLPAAVRLGAVEVHTGTWVGAGQPLANVTGTEQVVSVELEVRNRSNIGEGSPVAVLLPDGARVDATVRSIGRAVATPGGSDEEVPVEEATVTVVIELSGLPEDLDLDAAPVVVIVERVLAEQALTVPVGALVARPGGGYALERVDPAGDAELIAVEPGEFADGLVEISGEIAEGDEVGMPS